MAKKKKTPKDFVKKKKKVGKLAKSQDTLISIKTRKIVLPTQHSTNEQHIIFKGKSLNELVSGTKHTNSNQRVSNLGHLLEMLSNHVELITHNVGSLLERIGVLLQDLDENVRSSSLVLTKYILSNISDDDLLPFFQIFIVQISSGMLHLDKGVQKATVQVLQILLQTHSSIVMKHLHCLINSLLTLLTTSKAKKTILLYLDIVMMLLECYRKSMIRSTQSDYTRQSVKTGSVELYKYTNRRKHNRKPELIDDVVIKMLIESCLPHIEAIWLEDAPSQVYVNVDPSTLRTSILIVKLLKTFHACKLGLSTNSTIKLNNITKSVNGRFPFQCSISNRDVILLWKLNMVMSEYLMLVDRPEKVETYFLYCFTSKLDDLTEEQTRQSLSVVSKLNSTKLTNVVEQCCVSQSHLSQLFLVHFVKNHLQLLNTDSEIYMSLKKHIKSVAPHIIQHFYCNKRSILPEIFTLCLEKETMSSLREEDQIRGIELCFFSHHVTPKYLSDIGQTVASERVLDKFYSLLQALYHDKKLNSADFISILITQANKDDEDDESEVDKIICFTKKLLANFDILPGGIKQNLLSLTLPLLVTQLYSGLSHFSLYSYLLILLRFVSYLSHAAPVTGVSPEATSDLITDDIRTTNSSSVELPRDDKSLVKLTKIISSLIFNKDSISDWGKDIVILSVRLSFALPDIFLYIVSNFSNKPSDILSWYFSLLLKTKLGQDLCVREKDSVYKMYEFLKPGLSEHLRQEYKYRLNIIYENNS